MLDSWYPIDFFTVATLRLQVLYVFIVLAHDRRRVVHFNVTQHPTAVWAAQQIIEAFKEDRAPGLCFGAATESTAIPSHRESKEWASKKFTLHHGVLGRIAMSSG